MTEAGRGAARRALGALPEAPRPAMIPAQRGKLDAFHVLTGKNEQEASVGAAGFGVAVLCLKKAKKPLPIPWRSDYHKPSSVTPHSFFNCLTNGDENAWFLVFFSSWSEAYMILKLLNWVLMDFSPSCPVRRNISSVGYGTNIPELMEPPQPSQLPGCILPASRLIKLLISSAESLEKHEMKLLHSLDGVVVEPSLLAGLLRHMDWALNWFPKAILTGRAESKKASLQTKSGSVVCVLYVAIEFLPLM